MRIVVSGTHASGKSTLISDFVLQHPEFAVLPDPFELLDEVEDAPSAAMIAAQLRITAERLLVDDRSAPIIAERGPIDFLAYLYALADLTGRMLPIDAMEGMAALTTDALSTVDLLVVLPLAARDAIPVGTDEHLGLRQAMDDVLLDLIGDPEVVGEHLVVVEITGDPDERLAMLEEHTGTSQTPAL